MDRIHQLLTSDLVSSLLSIHPNDIGKELEFEPPTSWLPWWNWVQDKYQGQWLQLSNCFNSGSDHSTHDVPLEICTLIQNIQRLQLPRQPIDIGGYSPQDVIADRRGMSPKKIHEVSRMAVYIAELLNDLDVDSKRVRIVDVGAGQGHLTRTLKLYLQTSHILALDSDQWQTKGSQIWEERVARALRAAGNDSPSTPIFHKTIHITPDTLIPAIDGWVRETKEGDDGRPDPVLFIALHACGSLTPDVLRACINATHRTEARWTLAGAVVVGCCYNLVKPTDFPLSKMLKTMSTPAIPFTLPPSAFNLATQIPSQWLMSPRATTSVSLSIRKVVWRALLGRELMWKSAFGEATRRMLESGETPTPLSQIKCCSAPPSRQHDNFESPPLGTGAGNETGLGIGTSATMRLLGRLPDSAYTTWDTFLHAAGQKMGVDLSADTDCEHDLLLERRLEVQHVLRCLIGPLVESLIILDRVHWLREELTIKEPEDTDIPTNNGLQESSQGSTPEKRGNRTRVEAINLFDQATGSGRNVAIIIVPAAVSSKALSLLQTDDEWAPHANYLNRFKGVGCAQLPNMVLRNMPLQ